ncbi:MAG: cyclic nucleotide-binding domain-containing protein [Desulfobacterales bacterium]
MVNSLRKNLSFLIDNPMFKGLSDKQLEEVIQVLEEVNVKAGEIIAMEGDPASELYFITSGTAEVFKKEPEIDYEHRLSTLSTGDSIGEMAVLDCKPRSASVRAVSDCSLLMLKNEKLHSLSAAEESAYSKIKSNLSCEMSERLRQTNEMTVRSLRMQLAEEKSRVSMGILICMLLVGICLYVFSLQVIASWAKAASTTTVVSINIIFLFAAMSFFVIKKGGYPFSMYGLTVENWRQSVIESIVWLIPILLLLCVLKWLYLTRLPGMQEYPLLSLGQHLNLSKSGLILTCFAYSVFAPVQEFIARGCFQSSFQNFLMGKYRTLTAVVISNLMFSMTHLHISISFALVAFIPGLFWGWQYARHQTLIGISISHIIMGLSASIFIGFPGVLS